jgi:hypothetical protein
MLWYFVSDTQRLWFCSLVVFVLVWLGQTQHLFCYCRYICGIILCNYIGILLTSNCRIQPICNGSIHVIKEKFSLVTGFVLVTESGQASATTSWDTGTGICRECRCFHPGLHKPSSESSWLPCTCSKHSCSYYPSKKTFAGSALCLAI